MLVLYETAAGHALFKVQDSSKLSEVNDIAAHFATPEQAAQVVKLKAFNAFKDTTEAVAAAADIVDSQIGKGLKKFLKKCLKDEDPEATLAVTDKALGGLIKEKIGVQCVHNDSTNELMRGIRAHMDTLLTQVKNDDMKAMTLGLSHSLSRYKLKFSADKIDTMIVQAIGLLDELDKEINTYSMRVREWFGWHFPEMSKIVTDNLQYAKCVLKMGMRQNASGMDFSDILEESIESAMKDVCEISMGTEINVDDVLNISSLCEQVISLTEYRAQLYDYLQNRMTAIAPNLTIMVGELVGARLIAHAGSLMNLAKQPASTVQILGAEKALFRALKTKHDTPKYGLIYHASLIGQAAPKNKGKISRVLAAKTALAIRVDALGDEPEATIGYDNRAKVEARLRQLDTTGMMSNGKVASSQAKYTPAKVSGTPSKQYNTGEDVQMKELTTESKPEKKKKKRKAETQEVEEAEVTSDVVEKKKAKKSKKAKKDDTEAEVVAPVVQVEAAKEDKDKKKKKKKKKAESSE